ncbi:hypothetical protein [Marinomonas posidonica]|uniref:Uncharacterized protein n=1 Tax=Marinomonas posidonica (strain CECT 7376 / NCIMB 14433 / IVIA-Po-181) TaxID=491952 RepID=F6CTT9_MARPP|nr:hypothetical protein [Marinomonas posidonica]AEF56308.1 hypothetical protein Mar181_3288 [Marinomonas posidonica IVIA-Po-181]
MVLFFPAQQDLDCISQQGQILGKIKFDGMKEEYVFHPDNEPVPLTEPERQSIAQKLSILRSGASSIPMQDDD